MENSCEKYLVKYLITWTGKVLLRTYKSSMRLKVVVFGNKLLKTQAQVLERTRHLMYWHDGSTIDGHGYIAITISMTFDVAGFFSDEEYFLKYGENVCVQSIVSLHN